MASLRDLASDLKFNLSYALRRSNQGPKVFCIGFNKTGTTTLGKALETLGYNNSSFNKKIWRVSYRDKDWEALYRYASKFDSFDDLPWLLSDVFPKMDDRFPGSKFIFLMRENEDWKRSYKRWHEKVFHRSPNVEKGLREIAARARRQTLFVRVCNF